MYKRTQRGVTSNTLKCSCCFL